MKKLLYLFLLLLPILSFAQSRYGVEGVPVCWRTPLGVDSSLNRYVVISSTGKPVQTIVYENANGVVVNVSGGSMRYGYCDCIDYTVPDSSITWAMLTDPVKDSIRFTKRDTFITVDPSTNYFQNNIDNPAKFYNNIYFSCKGRTDTSIVVFLANPVWEEQKGVVYHIKNDSGLVAAFIINYYHLSNSKRFYLLQRGQTAQVRLLPDAANGGNYGWAVNVVWDSIGGGGGNGIYGGTDSLSQENTIAKMAADGSQTFGLGYFPSFPDGGGSDYGLFINPTNSWQELSLRYNTGNDRNTIGASLNNIYLNSSKNHDARIGALNLNPGSVSFRAIGSSTSSKYWRVVLDSLKFEITRNISGTDRTYQLLPPAEYPSTTETNILKWTAGVPSFGYRYETDNIYSDVNVKMDNTKTLAIGNFASFPSLGYDGTDAGLYLSEYNGSMNLAYGDALMDVFDDSFRFGVYDFTGTASGDFVQLILSKSTNQISFAGDNGTPYSYSFAKDNPSSSSGAISTHIWTAGTPSFLRSQHKTISGTTDGSGDITITFDAAMPDATYTVIVTGQGATPYVYMTQPATLATGSVKVRMFTLAGAAATSTAYQISYEVKDTN